MPAASTRKHLTLPLPNLNRPIRSVFPADGFEVRRCAGGGRIILVRRDAGDLTVVKPDDSEVMITEAGTGLAVLPRLVFSAETR